MTSFKNLEGQRFGRLTVLDQHTTGRLMKWLCRCDCGQEKWIYRGSLLCGTTKSCGCLRRETTAKFMADNKLSLSHGKSRSKTYRAWSGLKQRCFNQKEKQFKDYGGRGITVCERWVNSFEAFLADMGECPEGMSIDRIDNDGNYEPGNCHWTTKKEQSRNTRGNHPITFNGKTQTAIEWAEELGISAGIIRNRLYSKLPTERVLEMGDMRGKYKHGAKKSGR